MHNLARILLLPIAAVQWLALVMAVSGSDQRGRVAGLAPEALFAGGYGMWAVIFAAFLAFAVLANLRSRHVEDRLAAPLALAGSGLVIWMFGIEVFGFVWLNVLLLPILFGSWWAAFRLDVIGGFDGTGRRVLSCLVTGLLAGWLTIMLALSVAGGGRWLLARGASDAVWHSLWLVLVPVIILAWVFASKVSRNGWFFAALAWGLMEIGLNNWYRTELHGLAIAILIVGWIVIGRRIRYGAAGSAGLRE